MEKNIAIERIGILFGQAEKSFKEGNIKMCRRYVSLARKIAMKMSIRMPPEFRRRFCRKCDILWVPGRTVRIRIQKQEKKQTYTCLACGNLRRYPFS